MFGRGYYPTSRFMAPPLYGARFLPFRGLIGGGLFLAGLIVIGNMLAPQLVEQAIPNWKSQYGTVIILAVVLGFIRAIWRMFVPLVGLAFWIVAITAVMHPSMPKGLSLPNAPRFMSQVVPAAAAAPAALAPLSTKPIIGSKSLPDGVYFRANQSQGLGMLSKIPGVSSIAKLLK